jgi:hypothetical protein
MVWSKRKERERAILILKYLDRSIYACRIHARIKIVPVLQSGVRDVYVNYSKVERDTY